MFNALLPGKQFYSIADQILLSLANLIASYWLLSSVGVEIFGLYSFLMVVCNLLSGSFSSFLHGQMTLRIAGEPLRLMQSTFRSTVFLYILLFGCMSLLAVIVLLTVDSIPYFEGNKRAIAMALTFAFLLSMFDLFRKYAYVVARQDISVLSTAVYFVLLMSGMSLVPLEKTSALYALFAILCVSKMVALGVNYLCLGALLRARTMSFSARLTLLSRYWRQGKFSFLGMLTSWVQNQGITPFLMFVAGPLIVGYFSLARLLTVPINVVNAGLINSALPRLREAFNQSGVKHVERQVQRFTGINVGLSVVYFLALFVFHSTGVLDYFFNDYANAVWFLVIWSVVAMTILFRSWLTQQYVVAMQFQFLLLAGIASASVTYLLIAILYFTTYNYYTVPAAVWLGETFLIVVLWRSRARVLYENAE